MKFLVAFAMLGLLGGAAAETLFLLEAAADADRLILWEILGVETPASEVPTFVFIVFGASAFVTWCAIVWAIWPLHQLVWADSLTFQFVGLRLKRSAYGGLAFWLGSTIIYCGIPALIVWVWGATPIDPYILVPIGFETVFLIFSITFLTIGKTLEHAEDIEEEMKSIL